MYCVNGKPRSSLFIESTDSIMIVENNYNYIMYVIEFEKRENENRVIDTMK